MLVMVCGAFGLSEITMSPQLVVKVRLFASFFAGAVGCFTLAGVCPLAVDVLQPGTVVGFSAAIETGARVAVSTRAARTAAVFFIIAFLFPLNSSRWLASDIEDNAVDLTDLIGNTC